MLAVLIGLAILLLMVLIALKMGLNKDEEDAGPNSGRIIHVSGIYSVVRDSPREALAALRPSEDDLRRYLSTVSADISGAPVGERERADLIRLWKDGIEANLRTIEDGDKCSAAFYFYDYPGGMCPVCERMVPKGSFVTREEIHNYPQVIPPFHLGCTCALSVQSGDKILRDDTTITGVMTQFFGDDRPPPLPEWTAVVSPSSSRAER